MKEEYCRNHCLARTAKSAVERLSERLANQKPLTQISLGEGVNDRSAVGIESMEVPLACARCNATNSRRIALVVALGSGDSACDVCATKVVKTLENRPA